MNTKADAIAGIQSFLKSSSRILLLTGTYQNMKHVLLLKQVLTLSQPVSVLFRANSREHIEQFLNPVGIQKVPEGGARFGTHRVYGDTINTRSWQSSPAQVDVAVVYPADSLDARSGPVCVEDLMRRAQKVCLVSWTDNKDLGWTSPFNPVRLVYDAEEERPDYHKTMLSHTAGASRQSFPGLPEYAQSTPAEFLVKIYCDTCAYNRWARLNKPYPGDDALKAASMGEYIATCLMCRAEALDNYNWGR